MQIRKEKNMKSFKKILALLAALSTLVLMTAALAACGDGDKEGGDGGAHTHTFESAWTSDANGHYKKSTCGHSDSVTVIPHADGNSDGKCDVCDFVVKAPDDAAVYTVTVLDTEGAPVVGATVTLVQFTGTETATTDKYGRATFEVVEPLYVAARLTAVPAGYELPSSSADTQFPSGVTTLTFDGVKKLVEYTFTVLDPDGFGIEGASVQICTGEDCRPGTTDMYGKFTTYISAEKAASEGVKAMIVSLPAGYVNAEGIDVPFEYIHYGEDETEVTAYAAETASYSVTVSDLFGTVFAGVSVSLYNGDGELVDTKLSNEYGFCEFFVPEGTYTVEVAHPNSAFQWTNSSSNTLTPDNNTYVANLVESSERAEYVFNVTYPDGAFAADAHVHVFTTDGECEGALAVNAKGMAVTFMYNADYIVSISNPAGNYVCFELPKNGASTVDVVIPDNVRGADKDSSIAVYEFCKLPFTNDYLSRLPIAQDYPFEAGESLWIRVPFARNKVFTIDGSKFDVEYNGEAVAVDADGRASITFDVPLLETAYVKVTAKEACTEDITFIAPGSSSDPYYITSNEASEGYTLELNLVRGETAWLYMYSSKDNRTLTVTSNKDAEILINGGTSPRPLELSADANISVTALEDGVITVTLSYAEIKRDYKAFLIGASEDAVLSGITLTLYKLLGEDYVEVATAVTNELGEATFADVYFREDYYVAVTHPELVKEYMKVDNFDESTALFAAHVKDGTEQYPFATELGDNALVYAEAGKIWYDFHIIGSASYTFTAPEGVTTEIYVLADGVYVLLGSEGENTFSAYGITASEDGKYVFASTGVFGFAFTADKATETSFNVVSNAKTRENAISVDALGDCTVAIKDGETSYYRLDLEGTVTVTAPEGTVLSKITLTELGEVTENLDSQSFTVTLDSESEVFFRLSSETDGDVTVSIVAA